MHGDNSDEIVDDKNDVAEVVQDAAEDSVSY